MGEYFEKTKQKTLNWQLLTSWNTEEGQIASLIKTPQTLRTFWVGPVKKSTLYMG